MTKLATLILAAGQGTRMKSNQAKVLHQLGHEPMINYPVRLALGLGSQATVVVVGYQGDQVQESVDSDFPGKVAFRTQREQKGTGHAVIEGMKGLEGHEGRVLILYGDVPLLEQETISKMTQLMNEEKLSISLITARFDNPKGYGRILRDSQKRLVRIVEEKDASEDERQVGEINVGIYCVDSAFLRRALDQLTSDNAQGEYYLTDIVGIAVKAGLTVGSIEVENSDEVRGANTRAELAELAATSRRRIADRCMAAGVTLVDPERTYIGDCVRVGKDTVIEPGVHLRGETVIGENCHIDTGSVLTNARLGDGVIVKPHTVVEDGVIENEAIVGPFSRIRPGAQIKEKAHVGNFVEIKKATIGPGAKANHLAYIGDAKVGGGSNVGAGTITCNYDGFGKHLTDIGDDVFIGSNATLVAPVKIGDGAYIAAGSTITDAVERDDLAFGRARQSNKRGRAVAVREAAKRAKEAKKQK